jgi:hypothetical protein
LSGWTSVGFSRRITSDFLLKRAGLHFAVLPVAGHRSARGQTLLTAGPYIMHHGQREHLRNNRYQLNRIDSHVDSGKIISVSPSPQTGFGSR